MLKLEPLDYLFPLGAVFRYDVVCVCSERSVRRQGYRVSGEVKGYLIPTIVYVSDISFE